MADNSGREGRQAGGELVIPVLAVAFTIYFFTTIIDSPWTAQVSAFIVGGALLAFCAIFFVRVGLELRDGEADFGFSNLVSRQDLATGRVGLLAASVGYCVLIGWLGFTLTTFLFLAVSMAILGRGKRLGLVLGLSAVMSLGGWALFIWAFDTRFPRGWFETTMKAALANG